MNEQTVRKIVKEEVRQEVSQQLDAVLLKMFAYFDKRFDESAQRHRESEARLNHLYGALDGHEKRIETLEQDHAAGNQQLGRHDIWIKQLAGQAKANLAE